MVYTPQQFVQKWQDTTLGERQSYQLHFIDLCQLVGHEPPGAQGIDSQGRRYAFEYGIKKDLGGQGFADVFYEGHFAIEYKGIGKYKDLNDAYRQLQQYREKLNNPPLLVVTDIENWAIHTNWPNTEKKVYEFKHADIANRPSILKTLRDLFEAPDRLHPRRNTEQVTTDAARAFQLIADNMRDWEAAPDRIAHFLTKLVFCLFAEDAGLLPSGPGGETGIFAEIIERTRREPLRFMRYAEELFKAMADGGEVLFQKIPYFNGALFEDVQVEELKLEALNELEKASNLNWASVEPAIFGTLFERSLDPGKRAQLGAHYTSRDDILLIVEPVLMQPLRREWDAIKIEAAPIRESYDAALKETNRRNIKMHGDQLETLRETMLRRLREVKVLDPACGSGNFLYVSLQLLMDMEKAVILDDLFAGLQQPFPEVHPRQMYGIEKDPIAHALASIVVWIGYIQWQKNNGYISQREPILEDLHGNIRCMDAIMTINYPHPPQSNHPHPLTPSPLREEGEQNPAVLQIGDSQESLPSLRSGEGPGVGMTSFEEEDSRVGMTLPHTRTTRELWDKLKPLAREMRKEPTPAENALWQRLRSKQLLGYKFRRQHPIDRFIVDFYCTEARLVVEVDGPIHDYTPAEDAIRTEFIESLGLRVIRFTNGDVLQHIDAVLERIGEELHNSQTNHPQPLSLRDFRWSPASGEEELTTISEPDWPEVDVIVGNPPFLGGNKIRAELGDYVDKLFKLYDGRVPAFADLVCYWFEKARAHIMAGKAKRAGLLATNSIRGGVNREVLKRIKDSGDIFMAWSDRDWVLEGAAVRVSMVGFGGKHPMPRQGLKSPAAEETKPTEGVRDSKTRLIMSPFSGLEFRQPSVLTDGDLSFSGVGMIDYKMLDGRPVASINADLTASVDITWAKQLKQNLKICFIGAKKAGDFDIDAELAKKFLGGSNSSGRNNSDVVFPWLNGERIVKRMPERWIISFADMLEDESRLYEKPFQYVLENIYVERQKNNEERARVKWWQHRRPATEMREAVAKLNRFIATPRVSKHRIFAWYPSNTLPDDGIYIFARDDDYFFGVLHSRIHEIWSLRMGTWLGKGNDPRYTPTTTFETFPFPWPPGKEDTESDAYKAIASAAKQLHEERAAWLNPPGVGEKALKDRTLTNLYNALNGWRGKETIKVKPDAADFAPRLDALHTALDKAVCAAYGWPESVLADDEEILRRLLELNLARAGENA